MTLGMAIVIVWMAAHVALCVLVFGSMWLIDWRRDVRRGARR